MPHRKCEERPGGGARRQNEGDRSKPKDTTPVSHGTDGYTPEGRKSGPGRWVRLSDLLPTGPVTEAQLRAAAQLVDAIRDREAA
jgi:hypothetical protein